VVLWGGAFPYERGTPLLLPLESNPLMNHLPSKTRLKFVVITGVRARVENTIGGFMFLFLKTNHLMSCLHSKTSEQAISGYLFRVVLKAFRGGGGKAFPR